MKALPEYETLYKGTAVYFEVLRGFLEVFQSKESSFTLSDRITAMATAVFFIRGWNKWLAAAQSRKKGSAGSELCQTNNGLSREACIDLEICAGEFVTVVAYIEENPQLRSDPLHGFDPERLVRCATVVFAL